MGKYYKMTIDHDDNIHIIINKKGYGKDYHEKQIDKKQIQFEVINKIIEEMMTYRICIDDRVTGEEVFNAILNIIYNYK